MYVNELVRAVAENFSEGDESPLAVMHAAAPYFSVRLSAICVEKRELDVLQEFVLRAIGLRFSEPQSIGGFLGTRADEIASELSSLAREYLVVKSTKDDTYALTEKGVMAISHAGLRRVVEREAACYVNGVTRKVEQMSDTPIPRRRLPRDSVVLPAVPARAPKISELDVAGVRAAMAVARTPVPRSLEITRLGRVLRTSTLFIAGHMILRRGRHRGPIICAQGSANSDLTRLLGGHPAIEGIKAAIEGDEKRARSFIRGRILKLLNVKLIPPDLLRRALTDLIAYADASQEAANEHELQFRNSAGTFLNATHWISVVEWHVLWSRLTLGATQRVLLVTPQISNLIDFDQLARLGALATRGIDVELVMLEEDARHVERDERLAAALAGVKLTRVQAIGAACGFCCDKKHLVIGTTRSRACSMGRYETFFGAYCVGAQDPEGLLLGCLGEAGATSPD